MSSLAQRIRDFRYKKGLGPDALAARADISRTALYQIECGKTEVPRAGTLRRIAQALDVPIEELLGFWPEQNTAFENESSENHVATVKASVETNGPDWAYPDDAEVTSYPESKRTFENVVSRVDLFYKLEELLDSRYNDTIARVIEETHDLMLASRARKRKPRNDMSKEHAVN